MDFSSYWIIPYVVSEDLQPLHWIRRNVCPHLTTKSITPSLTLHPMVLRWPTAHYKHLKTTQLPHFGHLPSTVTILTLRLQLVNILPYAPFYFIYYGFFIQLRVVVPHHSFILYRDRELDYLYYLQHTWRSFSPHSPTILATPFATGQVSCFLLSLDD